jgi:hypothetical protein
LLGPSLAAALLGGIFEQPAGSTNLELIFNPAS